ncbi:ScbA/BarX family gamma-butyrolactone biosynthesis protein [Streptomyces sp. NPDC050095]|uniref:ScbA/BarX family gamma-butyrolactone biosynthesis protein n=1 Tax=unclassified Streptomyces TaxID=2593676 RepID=UPI003448EE05
MSSTTHSITQPAGRSAAWAPVSNEHVHKLAGHERLLHGWRRTGADSYVVAANWPAQHSFYGTRAGLHDPVILVESARQCIPLLSHLAYDAPMDHRQTWNSTSYALSPAALAATSDTTEVELHIDCKEVTRRSGRLSSLVMEVDVVRDGTRIGTAHTRFANHPPALYRRIRGARSDVRRAMEQAIPLVPPLAPVHVARDDFADVVLSPTDTKSRYQLRVDLNHPVLFDHAVDHVPGMLLVEAARQAAHAVHHPQPMVITSVEAVFIRYGELDAPCWIQAEPVAATAPGHESVHVTAHQGDHMIFTATVTAQPLRS